MRKRYFRWLGKEFISFSAQARPDGSVADQTKDLFRRAEREFGEAGLSLENTVRVRIWGKDREARTVATAARAAILTARSKAASSSYVSAARFDSNAQVALDLLAMAPSDPTALRTASEFDPPRNYLRFLRYDSFVFVSGFTSELDGLENQVREVFSDLNEALKAAGTGAERVVKAAVFLNRNQNIETAKRIATAASRFTLDLFEFEPVDGFARDKGLLEVEVTALTEVR